MDILKKIRKQGFTLAQVAAQTTHKMGGGGISQPTLSPKLTCNPNNHKLGAIDGIIGVPVAELVSDSPGITALVPKGDDY